MNREILILRETVVKLTQLLTGMGLKVTQQGTSAFVKVDARTQKPELINIPHIPDNAEKDLILAIQGFVDHEVAHVLFTDWSVVKRSNAKGEKFNSLRNILEDTFIEREMGKKFPGSVYNVKQLHRFFLDKITLPALDAARGNPSAEFSMLLVPLMRSLAGQEIFQDFMKGYLSHPLVKALMDRLPKEALARIPKIRNSQESFDLAQVFYDIIHPPKVETPPGSGTGDDEERCNKKGKGDSDSKSKAKPDKSDKSDEKDEEKPEPKKAEKKPEPKDEDETEDEDDEPTASDDEEDGEDDASSDEPEDEEGDGEGENDADGDGDDAGEDEDDGSSGSDSDDADDEQENGDSGAGDDDDEDDGAAGDGSDGEDGEESDDEGDGSSGDAGKLGAKGATPDDDQEFPEETGVAESDEEEGGKGNPKPSPFQTTDVAAARDFEDLLSGKIKDDTSSAMSSSNYRIFTTDFDRIERLTPSARYQDSWLEYLDDKTRSMVGLMQKEIERMMAARSQNVKVPGYRSGRLNSAGLHRIMTGDDRVFRRLHEAKSLDTEVGLLIDNSGSMDSDGKIEIAMATGYALSQTLERVGIKHEVIGFTTDGSGARGYSYTLICNEERRTGMRFSRIEPLYMPIYKDFEERLTPEVKRRFASTAREAAFMRSNIDGECVEIAVKRLARRPAKRKVLLVLSDGQPAGAGIHHEQIGKLRSAIADAPKHGVDLIGIGILDASVRGYYPKNIVLSDLSQLPKTVMGQLKQILTAP